LEFGTLPWEENTLTANYVLDELPDETLIDNQEVLRLINVYREMLLSQPASLNRNFFFIIPICN
jgi:hypothetical protein